MSRYLGEEGERGSPRQKVGQEQGPESWMGLGWPDHCEEACQGLGHLAS